jgi:uncharacterized NAD(P)/FAD-binding protein YdhS
LANLDKTIRSIAVVGGGPTAIYTLLALVNKARHPFALTIFEDQASLGRGTPYRPGLFYSAAFLRPAN